VTAVSEAADAAKRAPGYRGALLSRIVGEWQTGVCRHRLGFPGFKNAVSTRRWAELDARTRTGAGGA